MSADGLHLVLPAKDGYPLVVGQQLCGWLVFVFITAEVTNLCCYSMWMIFLIIFYIAILAGSTSSSLCDHWINRLPGSRPASLASGASSRRTSLASLAESVEFPGERSEDDGEAMSFLIFFSVR